MLEDSTNCESATTQAIQQSIQTAIDQAVLGFGTGTAGVDRPAGLCDSNLTTELVSNPLGIGDYSMPIQAVRRILEANYPGEISNITWLSHPAIAGTYQTLQASGTGQYLEPPPWVKELKKFSTTTLTNGTSADSVNRH